MPITAKYAVFQNAVASGDKKVEDKQIKKCRLCEKDFVKKGNRLYCIECYTDPRLQQKMAKKRLALFGE